MFIIITLNEPKTNPKKEEKSGGDCCNPRKVTEVNAMKVLGINLYYDITTQQTYSCIIYAAIL